MKIEQLSRALEINKSRSINRAAQNLYISQSSLSSSIRALESELGRDIFSRSQEGVVLTPFGQQFIEHAKEILNHVEEIERLSTSDHQTTQITRLDVVVYYLFFASQVWSILCNLHANDNITLNYMEQTRSEIVRSVEESKAELGFVMMSSVDREKWLSLFSSKGIEYTVLNYETPHAVMGPHCELYEAKTLTLSQLIHRKMIVIPEEDDFFKVIDRKIFNKFSPTSYLTVCDRGSLIGILNETNGYYLGTHNKNAYSRVPFYHNIKCIPIVGADFNYEIGYVKGFDRPLSGYANEFLNMVQNVIG